MEGETTFMDWKAQHNEDFNFLQTDLQDKIVGKLFLETETDIS